MHRKPDAISLADVDPTFGRVLSHAAIGIARYRIDPPMDTNLPVDVQIAYVYENGETIEWNDTFATQYGYDATTDMRQIKLADLLPLSDERNLKFARKVVENGYFANREESFERDKDGNTIVFLNSLSGKIEDDKLVELWISMVDLTDLKWSQLHLLRSEERYAKAFQSSPDAIVITRLSDGKIVEANEGFEKMTGFNRRSVVGQSTVDLNLWWDNEERDRCIRVLEEGGKARDVEAEFRTRSGTRITCLTSAELIELHGETCVLSTTRDYTALKDAETERRRLEAQLRQAQKMEVMGQLTSGIVHDFNNILSSVIGYSELAAENRVVKHDEKVSGYLTEVQRAGQRARALVSQMLMFSRVSREALKDIDASDSVADVLRMLRPTLPTTIEVQNDLDQGMIHIDPVQFEQCLINLCINARDAMRSGGTLSIAVGSEPGASLACTICGEHLPSDHVSITVSDTGCGIPADTLSRLFEPFFSTKAAGSGTGMGLAMVDNIAHTNNGHVRVDSSTTGSSFTMMFPAASASAKAKLDARSIPDHRGGATTNAHILVVDDEKSVGALMGQLLESRGYVATVMNSSKQALDFFSQNVELIDAVVTDQTMPQMTGVELAKRLLEHRADLPIILCSGYSADVNETVAKQAGVRAYQPKPIDVQQFFTQLNAIMPSNKRIPVA